jgi:hypothetical protein
MRCMRPLLYAITPIKNGRDSNLGSSAIQILRFAVRLDGFLLKPPFAIDSVCYHNSIFFPTAFSPERIG